MSRRGRSRLAGGARVAFATAFAFACSSDELLYQTAVPGTAIAARVSMRGELAGYLDVDVQLGESAEDARTLRFLLPAADASCRALSQGALTVDYVNVGVLGTLRGGELRCQPAGVLSLAQWRDRRPREPGEPIPRSRATYRVVHRGEELILLRGRFGLAGQLGWAGGVDSIAVLEAGEACEALLQRTTASMEYRPAGSMPLSLVGPAGPCPILGLARPLSP